MRFLLDTQALIWSQDDPGRLPTTAAGVLTNPADTRHLSIASVWEIGIKVSIGKLRLSGPFRPWVDTAIRDVILTDLPITLDHVEKLASLPFHHNDPFDRILIAQALVENIPVVSIDTKFDAYGVTRIWN